MVEEGTRKEFAMSQLTLNPQLARRPHGICLDAAPAPRTKAGPGSTPPMHKRRSRFVALLLALALVSLACGASGGSPLAATVPPQAAELAEATTLLQDGSFQIPLPDWPELAVDDGSTLRAVQNDRGWAMTVARQPATPRLLARHLGSVLPEHADFVTLSVDDRSFESPLIEGLSTGDPRAAIRYDFRYCDGVTYQISASGPESSIAELRALYDGWLESAQCAAVPPPNSNQHGIVGLVINASKNDLGFENFRADAVAARQGGVRASHVYLTWGDIETAPGEYDWTVSELLIDMLVLEGIRMSAVVDFIHTSVPGKVPADLEGVPFDDPRYIERAAAFSVALAEHFAGQLDYLMLGNEINIYLEQHPDQVEPFLTAYQAMYAAVKQARPDLPVGTVLAFHEMMNAGDYQLLQDFKVGDFLAYTYYPHGPGFRYDGPTDGFGAVLDAMIEQSGETPFIVVENGWATSAMLGGSEESQAEYIRNSFQAIDARRGSVDRLIWYGLHDGERELCEQGGLSFFEQGFDPGSLGESWDAFVEYLCTLGFRNYDGTPKLGWQAFQEELAAYEAGR